MKNRHLRKLFVVFSIAILASGGLLGIALAKINEGKNNPAQETSNLPSIGQNSLIGIANPIEPITIKKVKVVVTAYSSTTWQTDSTPFITASGEWVKDGIVANNLLPFGTEIRIPEIYGDKIFVVEDRMNSRKGKYHVDIWFEDYCQAKDFGAKFTYIEVLES